MKRLLVSIVLVLVGLVFFGTSDSSAQKKMKPKMAHKGKIQLSFVIVAPPDQVEEGVRLFKSHQPWMEATHHRSGAKALLSYTVTKAAELSNPLDPKSAPTGNTLFILTEVYETEAGVADHFAQAQANWKDYAAFMTWFGKCTIHGTTGASIFNALW